MNIYLINLNNFVNDGLLKITTRIYFGYELAFDVSIWRIHNDTFVTSVINFYNWFFNKSILHFYSLWAQILNGNYFVRGSWLCAQILNGNYFMRGSSFNVNARTELNDFVLSIPNCLFFGGVAQFLISISGNNKCSSLITFDRKLVLHLCSLHKTHHFVNSGARLNVTTH